MPERSYHHLIPIATKPDVPLGDVVYFDGKYGSFRYFLTGKFEYHQPGEVVVSGAQENQHVNDNLDTDRS